MDFISRDALIAAMNAWVLDKHKSLGQVLVDQGNLPIDSRDLLEAPSTSTWGCTATILNRAWRWSGRKTASARN